MQAPKRMIGAAFQKRLSSQQMQIVDGWRSPCPKSNRICDFSVLRDAPAGTPFLLISTVLRRRDE